MITQGVNISDLRALSTVRQASSRRDIRSELIEMFREAGIGVEDIQAILGIFEKINSYGSLKDLIKQITKILQIMKSIS